MRDSPIEAADEVVAHRRNNRNKNPIDSIPVDHKLMHPPGLEDLTSEDYFVGEEFESRGHSQQRQGNIKRI